MKEKLYKTGLKRKDYMIRRTAIACVITTAVCCSIFIPVTLTLQAKYKTVEYDSKELIGTNSTDAVSSKYILEFDN